VNPQAHVAAGISAVAAGASITSWLNDNAVFFTVAAATAAVLSGIAAFVFYVVSIYYKIKSEAKKNVV
jgi:hypothetical protein